MGRSVKRAVLTSRCLFVPRLALNSVAQSPCYVGTKNPTERTNDLTQPQGNRDASISGIKERGDDVASDSAYGGHRKP